MKEPAHVSRLTIRRREDAVPQWERPFLSLHRLRVVNTRADGTESSEYAYDAVLRVQLDAVAVILTSGHPLRPSVLLRACLRPPLLLRADIEAPLPESPPSGILWELPAGLLELADRGASGILRRAATETLEETGYRLPPAAFILLPGAPFVTPGSLPERIHFARAHVDDIRLRERPSGDGSPVEEGPLLRWVSLDDALASCDAGEIDDMKTELGLRRLAGLARIAGAEVRG